MDAGVPTAASRDLRRDEEADAVAFLDALARALRGEDRRARRGQGRARHRVARPRPSTTCARSSPAQAFGDAGRRVVIEEGLTGPELSLLASATASGSCRSLRRRTTSASATATPVPTPAAWARTRRCRRSAHDVDRDRSTGRCRRAHARATCGARASTTGACSTPGSCSRPTGPKIIEYNVRFGDPEAQVVLPRRHERLRGASRRGRFREAGERALVSGADAAVTVMMCDEGLSPSRRDPATHRRTRRASVMRRRARLLRRVSRADEDRQAHDCRRSRALGDEPRR